MSGRTILFGGSFDPIHNGHIDLCKAAALFADADRVVLIPTIPPYKLQTRMASGQDRLQMCLLATEDLPDFSVDDREIRAGVPAYTADTVEAIRAELPDDELYFLLGADAFLGFRFWKDWRRIVEHASLLVGFRGGEEREAVLEERRRLLKEDVTGVVLMENIPITVSSTMVRQALRTEDAAQYLDPKVLEYIRLRDLYYGEEEEQEAESGSAGRHPQAPGEEAGGQADSPAHDAEGHAPHGHIHSEAEKKAVTNRISRAIGHLEHIRKMVERGDDCSDILIQLAAVRSAINNTGKVVLHSHIEHCITHAVENGDMEEIGRMEDAIRFFIK